MTTSLADLIKEGTPIWFEGNNIVVALSEEWNDELEKELMDELAEDFVVSTPDIPDADVILHTGMGDDWANAIEYAPSMFNHPKVIEFMERYSGWVEE